MRKSDRLKQPPYTDLQELTPYVLNELIEKIVVHDKVIGPKAEGGYAGEVIKTPRPEECRSA